MQNYFFKGDMQHSAVNRLPITFTDSDSEYFLTGVVNSLLMFVTSGLHYRLNQAWYSRDAEKEADREAVRMACFSQAAII